MTVLSVRRTRARPLPCVPADRQRYARGMAYLGCAGAIGYGAMKVVWALGGTVGLSNPKHFHAIANVPSWGQRFSDHWGPPILAGLAIVILLGLVYPWGNRPVLRPLLRTLAWAGSWMAVIGGVGVILAMLYLAGDHAIGVGDLDPGTYVFTYICFLAIGLGLGGAAWLTRRSPRLTAPRTLSTSP